jgi:hypothetical protein
MIFSLLARNKRLSDVDTKRKITTGRGCEKKRLEKEIKD